MDIEKKALEAIQALEQKVKEHVSKTQDALDKATDEVKRVGAIEAKTADQIKQLGEQVSAVSEAVKTVRELNDRLLGLEQKVDHKPGSGKDQQVKSLGQLVVESEEFKGLGQKARSMAPVTVGNFHKTAIINASGQNQPLVPADRLPGIVTPGLRRFTVRDLLPQNSTSSNLIEFASENVFTNSAGPQFSSPNDRENVLKNESGITFSLNTAPVVTLAHWIPASRQVLSDAPMLAGYINNRLTYGLKLEEEEQLLLGDGGGGNLSGLYTNAAAYNRGASNDTKIDALLKAMLQVTLSEYDATGVVLNPIDWTDIQLAKDTQGRYLFSDPQSIAEPRMWGRPVVATNTMGVGTFLIGAFAMGAELFDREDASVRIAEQHDDFFVKNMVAILAEERLALVIYRTAAMVRGSLPLAGT